MKIALRHPGTGHVRTVETGWSWALFFASGFLGLPLFFRGLALWGAVMMIAWTLSLLPLVADRPGAGFEAFDWSLTLVSLALCGFLGLKGNALTAKRYIALGYEFAHPDGADARVAARSWGL